MYIRLLSPPKGSFFLFGARGTGKTTWIRENFKGPALFDLLPAKETLHYEKSPEAFRAEVLSLPKNQWIVIDEIQKVPLLLNEVHFLMENHGYKKFVLTGSSARKLKRGSANLLAGRAILRKMYPLNSKETRSTILPEQALRYGMLPMSVNARTKKEREDFLKSYVETYLREEIKYEGLVRNVGSFSRFLEIASLTAGQQVNMSNLAREAELSRDTVRSYFSIFEDTLIGSWLKAYRPRSKVKEVTAPKFYWFDPGVLHAAAGGFEQPLPPAWDGVLMEHWIYHELQTYLDYSQSRGTLGFWRTPSGSEIDFVWWYGKTVVGIEVKASKKFRPEFLRGLKSFSEKQKLKSSWVVYLGDREMKVGDTRVVPAASFLKRLFAGDILGAR